MRSPQAELLKAAQRMGVKPSGLGTQTRRCECDLPAGKSRNESHGGMEKLYQHQSLVSGLCKRNTMRASQRSPSPAPPGVLLRGRNSDGLWF